MAKKIYDIKPPKVAKKTERTSSARKKATISVAKPAPAVRRKEGVKFPWKVFVSVGGLAVILGAGFLYFKLQSATVEIWPSVENLAYSEIITADKAANAINLDGLVIPAKYIETEKTATKEFAATGSGSDGGKASGQVTIYNTASSSLSLKVGTRLLSDSGKYFTINSKVTVPGGSKSKPGSVKVGVAAFEGGDAYNIGPSNFSVPGLNGTNSYYSTYAVSTEAMKGGYTGEIKKVTQANIDDANDELVKELSDAAFGDLKDQLGSEYIVLDDAVSYDEDGGAADKKVGETVNSFKYTITVKASAVAFKKSDLDRICKDYIISKMGTDKTILDSSFASDYSFDDADVADGNVSISVNFSSGVYKTINKNSMALSLMGKSADEITEAVNANLADSSARVNVKFWPFWVKTAPQSQKAIKIELKF
ncbi:MAG TPA: hypothetical protein PLF16_01555 [Candidatus Staskawiczbacteria bacterium]|nr:hypothetical protein [Candidatus Staskawiczbacteria bacterium]